MLWEALRTKAPELNSDENLFGIRVMFFLAIATSLDVLAAGFTLSMFHVSLPFALTTIGATTALLSSVGLWAGRKLGALLGKRLDAFGGLVLIGLGTKILVSHLGAG